MKTRHLSMAMRKQRRKETHQKKSHPIPVDENSDEGRIGGRRKILLQALRELLRIEEPEAVTYAKVCVRAKIPRASAYHFFPNIGAMYLGLRLVHADLVSARLEGVDTSEFETWQSYVYFLAREAASVVREDRSLIRVVYGVRNEETMHIGKTLDSTIVKIALSQVEERFRLPEVPDIAKKIGIAVSLIDSVFRFSFREGGDISDEMVSEAGRAAVAYLRSYLPEYLPPRK